MFKKLIWKENVQKLLIFFSLMRENCLHQILETYDKATVNAECSMALPQSWNGET